MGVEETIDVSEQELLALGFEEVVEKEKDWIDECVHDIFEYQRGRPKEDETDTVSVRRIIEKHIPQQKKFTVKEVTDYYMKIEEGLDKGVVEHNKKNKIDVLITSAIVGFLRYHDLLEE